MTKLVTDAWHHFFFSSLPHTPRYHWHPQRVLSILYINLKSILNCHNLCKSVLVLTRGTSSLLHPMSLAACHLSLVLRPVVRCKTIKFLKNSTSCFKLHASTPLVRRWYIGRGEIVDFSPSPTELLLPLRVYSLIFLFSSLLAGPSKLIASTHILSFMDRLTIRPCFNLLVFYIIFTKFCDTTFSEICSSGCWLKILNWSI